MNLQNSLQILFTLTYSEPGTPVLDVLKRAKLIIVMYRFFIILHSIILIFFTLGLLYSVVRNIDSLLSTLAFLGGILFFSLTVLFFIRKTKRIKTHFNIVRAKV